MKVNRKELLNVLEKIKPGIANKDIVESMTYFLFTGEDVVTYNDKISIRHPFKTDFSLFVKAMDLYNILARLKEDDLVITEDAGKLNIACRSTKANLATIEDEEITARIESVTASLTKAKWSSLPENFNESVMLCSFTASKQESEGTLTCVSINGDTCLSSDNNRISYATLSKKMATMFIKASEIKNLVKIEPTSYFAEKAWLHFKNKSGCIFSIRTIIGEYPEFLSFFEFDGTTISLPKTVAQGVDIASILSDSQDPIMKIKISKGAIFLSISSDNGTIKHREKIDYDGEEINFTMNPNFLKEMMAYSSSITIDEDRAKLETESGFKLITSLYK